MRLLPHACLLLLVTSLGADAPPPTHWAFRPPHRPDEPQIRAQVRVRTPIDAFILAKLEASGLTLSPDAPRPVLLRRLTYDLIGLPPTPEEIDAFIGDARPDAYERVVERLLADPRHGERWAQHWLDVAHYAETNGYEADADRPQAWRYRDWVVSAMNADLPFDRFVTEQLAGDLLGKDSLVAAGFNRCGPAHQVAGNVDPLELRHEFLNEMTGGLGAAFLGLTLGCARCHDHKFDPTSQADYFRFEAFFSAAKMHEADLSTATEQLRHTGEVVALEAKIVPIRTRLDAIDAPYRRAIRADKLAKLPPEARAAFAVEAGKRTPAQKKLADEFGQLLKVSWDEIVAALSASDRLERTALRDKMHALRASAPEPPARAWTLEEGKGPLSAHVLRRGDIHKRGKKVTPGTPEFLGVAMTGKGNRLDLARWLVQPNHPLTARVIVNRLWQHHFGKGIVRTPNVFGLRGDAPTHPELLDWLAVELVESGWSLKHMHRLIVTSSVYRQGGKVPGGLAAKTDPDNRLLWHMPRRRLDAESLRDGILAATGSLTPRLGGPMVRVPLEPEVYDLIFTEGEPDGLWPVTGDVREHTRRSLYLFNKRTVRLPMLESFDQPDTLTSCAVRPISTFAPQALILLNSPFMHQQAGAFAVRLWGEADTTAQVTRAYRLALGRAPSHDELETALAFLAKQAESLRDRLRARKTVALPEAMPEGADPAKVAALADFCLALLNRNAFAFVE